jgi:gliding motility-associated-like protein
LEILNFIRLKNLLLTACRKIFLLLIILVSARCTAQVCTGSLGDPVFTIDFGAGNNPGAVNSHVSSAYQYTGLDCPNEGFYAIRNSTFFCFSNDWHVVPFDHSPNDPNGYFLLVNALTGPSLIYQDTISGLCPGISFETSAWIINLLKQTACSNNGIDPNLSFFITDLGGNIIAQYNSGNLPESDPYSWTQHRFLFNAPANGSIILKIVSNAGAGCGNEFALDDISFRPCGPSIVSTFANTSATQLNVCESNQPDVLLSSSYSGNFTAPLFQWQISTTQGNGWTDIAGANTSTYLRTPTPNGDYWYRCVIVESWLAGNPSCRFISNTLKVLVSKPPFAQATNYVFGCYGSTIYLFAAGGNNYEWFGPNGFYANVQGPEIPNVNFSHSGTYIVKVTTTPGCFAYDTTTLTIYAAPIASLTPTDISTCENVPVQLNAGGSTRYKWTPSIGLSNDTIANPVARPPSDITYTVRVYNEYTCYDTATVKITVWKNPVAFAGPDLFFRKGKSVQLTGNASGSNVSYSWSPPTYLDNPNYLKPIAKPPGTMTYKLTVTSNNGCGVSTDEVKVEAIDKLFIPTGFTPNKDGLNDKWEIVTFEDYENAVAEVYNRYGQLVYRGFAKNYKPWDGTFKGDPVIPGVYVYKVNLKNGKPILKGTLHLIR